MLKLTINTFLFYIYLKACNFNDIKTICCLRFVIVVFPDHTHLLFLNQNIALIISTECVKDGKCPFNIDSLDHKHPFNLLSSARSHDVKRWHDKSLHIIPVNTLSAT